LNSSGGRSFNDHQYITLSVGRHAAARTLYNNGSPANVGAVLAWVRFARAIHGQLSSFKRIAWKAHSRYLE
jgi:hypothetical protein